MLHCQIIPFCKLSVGKKKEALKEKIAETFGSRHSFAEKVGIQKEMIECVIRGLVILEEDDRQKWASALGSTEQELFNE